MRVFLGRCHMTKYVLQIGDDEHSTETMVNKNQIALNNSEHQLNDANKITKLDNIDNIVKNLVAMIEDYNTQNPTSLAYSHKLTLLKDKNVMKCIIKDVGPHDKGGIKLIVDENFRQQEIAHIEELDNNVLISMNRLYVIQSDISENRLKKIQFWNINFNPQEFNISTDNIYTYTEAK